MVRSRAHIPSGPGIARWQGSPCYTGNHQRSANYSKKLLLGEISNEGSIDFDFLPTRSEVLIGMSGLGKEGPLVPDDGRIHDSTIIGSPHCLERQPARVHRVAW